LNAIKERDKRDKNRPLYPFRPADDATVIDTTNLSIEEVLDKIFTTIRPYLNVFITGVGSGLGAALTEEFLKRGYKVYALSRHAPERLKNHEGFFLSRCDLLVLEEVYHKTKSVLSLINDKLPWVILNAGVLGELKEMRKTSLRELNAVLDVNLWSNKLIFDALLDSLNDETLTDIGQIIAISSGAAVNCNKGWNGYSISKAALNCTVKLYSHEFEKTHLASVAPGLILTPMLEKLLNEADEERFPSVKRLKLSPKHTPESAAKMLLEVFANLARFPSGSFLDVRREFAEIYQSFLP
jgi:alcohol dehydrogenase